MKVVYCIFSLEPPGGMQRVLTTKANYLADVNGYTVHIATGSVTSSKPYFTLSDKVTVHHLGNPYRKKLTNLLVMLRPEITISMFGSEYTFLYKINDGSKKILEFHYTKNYLVHLVKGIPNLRFKKLKLLYVWLLQRKQVWYARYYSKLVLLTNADQALWGSPYNSIVIPNPLSFKTEKKSALTEKKILAVGRYIATKGFDLLIKAFSHVSVKHPDWRLTILGEGQDRTYLEGLITHYDLEKKIELLPPVKNIQDELLESSVYAFSSRYDGFGLVLVEAMECGVPCVAFDCECGPGEIITNGVDGILVDKQDIAQFGEGLLQLVESYELRKSLGIQAQLTARKFSLELIMPQWCNLFNNVIHVQ